MTCLAPQRVVLVCESVELWKTNSFYRIFRRCGAELQEGGDVFDRVNDFLVMLDADGRCLAGAGHVARQQQDSPRREASVDHQAKSRKRCGAGRRPAESLMRAMRAMRPASRAAVGLLALLVAVGHQRTRAVWKAGGRS